MIIAHYASRLPENYDLGRIRALTKERAPAKRSNSGLSTSRQPTTVRLTPTGGSHVAKP
jgi:hypothetical protein